MGQGVHFRSTTPAQRRLLFETWQATGDVEAACASAPVGRRTFYSWKGRFEAGGYAALEQETVKNRGRQHWAAWCRSAIASSSRGV